MNEQSRQLVISRNVIYKKHSYWILTPESVFTTMVFESNHFGCQCLMLLKNLINKTKGIEYVSEYKENLGVYVMSLISSCEAKSIPLEMVTDDPQLIELIFTNPLKFMKSINYEAFLMNRDKMYYFDLELSSMYAVMKCVNNNKGILIEFKLYPTFDNENRIINMKILEIYKIKYDETYLEVVLHESPKWLLKFKKFSELDKWLEDEVKKEHL